MRLLTVAFLSSAEFLSHYSEKHAEGALFFRTRTELEEGEAVLVEISFAGLPNRALVRANVLSIEQGKGVWLAFDPADASTRDFLLRLARGEVVVTEKMERAHSRFPASLPVAIKVEQNEADSGSQAAVSESQTLDVSAAGVFIRASSPPPIGTRIQMMIGPAPGADEEKFILEGEVAWIREEEGEEGFGVHFRHGRNEDGRRLRTLLRRASESGRVRFVTPPESDD